jgi:hypothetical protein
MPKTVRIRTKVGIDQSVDLSLEQDFEFLEILSLKLSQEEIYERQCADYGVLVGRVSVNDGFGVPNAKVSIFLPIDAEDEDNPVISAIYPYKTISDINEDGYRYNLLPYKPSYPGHAATGSFPDLEDVLTNPTAIELYDKYYKFTVTTNDSGDFMIFGVPTGTYDIVMNVDLSDIGPFSQSPQDLIRLNIANESQVNGTTFQTSENLTTLPQLVFLTKTTTILPLWGDPELCQISITRTDFDLTGEANIEIKPTAIFMGSIFSDSDELAQKRNCKPKLKGGYQCSLFAGPGQILSIRQTIRQDEFGRPLLEEHQFENDGKIIDENGTWLLDVPMNLDYVITNEFGEQVFSTDEKKGIPTRARYRFKVKWNQSPSLGEPVKRASFLVPNIKEHGWSSIDEDPLVNLTSSSPSYIAAQRSYAFSLNWDDYGTQAEVIQDAIDCKDMFYEMTYNKVYTVSQLITGYRKGNANNRYLAIKNITDDTCESTTNKFPTNETQFRFDLLFILFTIVATFISIILKFVTVVFHIICFLVTKIRDLRIGITIPVIDRYVGFQPFRNWAILTTIEQQFSNLNIPLFTYPDCELCSCQSTTNTGSAVTFPTGSLTSVPPFSNNSVLANFINAGSYDYVTDDEANDLTTTIQNTLAGYQTTNPVIGWSFRTSNQEIFSYDLSEGAQTNIALLTYYSNSIPLHERLTNFNFKGKFFGNNNYKLTTPASGNSPLNTNSNSFQAAHTIGGGHTQIKVTFNSDINSTNTGLETQLGGSISLGITNQNLGFHYDNVMIIATEERYDDGTILTFNNPYNLDDPNLSGLTKNIYGTYSITGTPINTATTEVNVSHTNPYTGERLITKYNILQTNGEADNYLRYPTNQEYFQVIKSLTYSEYLTILNNNYFEPEYNDSYWGSFNQRMFNNFENIGRLYFSRLVFQCSNPGLNWTGPDFAAYAPYADGVNPWTSFNEKSETYFNIIVRGVDPHSSRVKVKYGLGKLFNRKSHWAVTFEGDYKLNIPLQPNDTLDFGSVSINPTTQSLARDNAHKCVKHDGLATNSNVDSYSRGRLFFKSFHFRPSNTDWTSFKTRTVYKYSSISQTDIGDSLQPYQRLRFSDPPIRIPSCFITNVNAYTFVGNTTNGGGLRVGLSNYFARENQLDSYPTTTQNFLDGKSFDNGKYAVGESVEGGSVMLKGGGNLLCETCNFATRLQGYYYSKVYPDPIDDNDCLDMINSERIVMRSDRVPSSDAYQSYTNPSGEVIVSHTLMANALFYITQVSDEGVTTGSQTSLSTPGFNVTGTDTPVPNSEDPESFGQVDKLLASFSCQSLVPIGCYQTIYPDSITIAPAAQCQYYSGTNERFFIEGSCYSLVHPAYLGSNLKKDLQLITEWLSRININFGACREVFSHIFMNNWVNGGLYMFPFKSQRFFTGPNGNPPNQPYNKYCRDTVYLEPETFNFYYRSTPWDGNDFIGREGYSSLGERKGNARDYMFPTTIMDLGPRDEIQKYLSQSGNWDGYIVNKLLPTTFSDTSDILNLFILSRFASAKFGALFSTKGANILNFFSRKALFVDSDYAQMVATNSQLGIAAFEPANYPEPPVGSGFNSPLYFPAGVDDVKNITFGIFFTGDSQLRDYISPNRTIYDSGGQIGVNEACSLSYIPVTTQVVPFYLWKINDNSSNSNIFGNQQNNWFSQSDAFAFKYQAIDRLYAESKNFQPENINIINYHKGWIANYNPQSINPATGEYDYKPEPGLPGNYLMGAPYYFYFGVVKGASAFDRFTTKWIDTDGIAD